MGFQPMDAGVCGAVMPMGWKPMLQALFRRLSRSLPTASSGVRLPLIAAAAPEGP